MPSSTISGKYGFNGGVNILGTLTTPAIVLDGRDLKDRIADVVAGQSTLETDLASGAVVPLKCETATTAITAEKSTKVVAVASNLQTGSYYIPFVSAVSGEVECNTAESDLLFVPATRTTIVRNLYLYGGITSCPSIVANTISTPELNATKINTPELNATTKIDTPQLNATKIDTPQLNATNIKVSYQSGNILLQKDGSSRATITLTTGADLEDTLADRVNLTSTQSIGGVKTFNSETKCNAMFGAYANSQIGTTSSNALTVKATSTFESPVSFTGLTTCNGNFVANANSQIGSDIEDTLTVKAVSTFEGVATFSNNVVMNGNASIGTQSGNSLTINASSTFGGDAIFNGETTCNGHTRIGTDNTDNLTVTATSSFVNDALFTKDVSVNKLISSNIQLTSPSNISYVVDATYIYLPSKHRNIVCSTETTSLCDTLNEKQLLKQYNFVNTTYITSTAILSLPPPLPSLVGCEFTLIQYGLQKPLALSVPLNSGKFNISNAPFSTDYVLDETWCKITFVCLPDPETADSYFWLQTFYQ